MRKIYIQKCFLNLVCISFLSLRMLIIKFGSFNKKASPVAIKKSEIVCTQSEKSLNSAKNPQATKKQTDKDLTTDQIKTNIFVPLTFIRFYHKRLVYGK